MMPDARTAWTCELMDYIRRAALFRGVEIVPYADDFGNSAEILWLMSPDDGTYELRVKFGVGDQVKEVRVAMDQNQMSIIADIQNAITDVLQADQGRQVDIAELERMAGLRTADS